MVAAAVAEPAPGLWLIVGPPHPTQKRWLAGFVLSKSEGELILPPKWPTCARRFLSQCPLPPPHPCCTLDHCPVAEHPGLRVSGEWERGGWEENEGGGWEKGGPSGLRRRGGEQFPLSPSYFLCRPASRAPKQLSFTLARLKPSHLTGTLSRGTDLLAFSPSPFLFLLSCVSRSPFPFRPPPSSLRI